ncbi:(2Fe-2S)-binding protein [Sulfitobacter sp. 20_GPM-1509m]|uniref:(2Fe-2S)-binding protein n=1 Tax=Sulfitobacter sp. 20_GPM-1509m TaxID=1380367 RepID=UPI000490EA91|nr:(2Fe-2S)-binding protein [Sulfitobacter sp. 20_GPM-1509m]
MFRRLIAPIKTITIIVDGAKVKAGFNDTVAVALLDAGISRFRISQETSAPRGLYCGMGVCFDCLVTIDGEGNQQACLTQVREGMVVTTGTGRRNISNEIGA